MHVPSNIARLSLEVRMNELLHQYQTPFRTGGTKMNTP